MMEITLPVATLLAIITAAMLLGHLISNLTRSHKVKVLKSENELLQMANKTLDQELDDAAEGAISMSAERDTLEMKIKGQEKEISLLEKELAKSKEPSKECASVEKPKPVRRRRKKKEEVAKE